jgi:hypothetical protein
MDFITWWFDSHYIVSTLLTPGFTFAWCIFYKASIFRLIISFLLALGVIIN